MKFSVYKYDNGEYQLILPQEDGHSMNLGNNMDLKTTLKRIKKILEMETK